ncbi:hypothetical protein M407DRAFT_23194 [Tulasnella calospora MUT 4182]|uniref:Cytochrome P450 n=1 Tax=Tulasnella calospora MUT 4182 TaxID=1051891 RepID=A0A0C3QLR6_9AGAM|nr:hypothetical protein M407DRAFT_23194 [Tulasnella calospora MUT 4182]
MTNLLLYVPDILDMPQTRFAIAFTKFGEEYGPLTWLTIPGQNILVVNSFEAAKELLEKRSSIFIDRPRFTMTNELLGLSNHLALSVSNDMWRRQRTHLKNALSAPVVRSDYSSLLETKARQFLERCAARPESIMLETTRVIGEAIIQLTYGKLEDERGRDYIQVATRLLDIMIVSLQGYVVDIFPALKYLPKWLPGMKFKRDAARWRKEICGLEDAIFGLAKENMFSDDPRVQSSFMFKRMQDLESKHEETYDVQQHWNDVAYCGLQIFFGGLETSEATMQSFIRAMTLFPSVQKKAQAEIERVIGSSRLPTFKDQPNLPYLHAVVLETLRWSPVVSIGVPRVSRKDDLYDGYFIPKGTTVIANAWGFSRNLKYYTNPSTFDPERFLKQPPELDPREFTFGYGRRLCPGQDLALQKVWILVASVLWAFNIVGTEDEPAPLADVDRFSFGMANRPMPFKCQLVPRHEGLVDKIADATM